MLDSPPSWQSPGLVCLRLRLPPALGYLLVGAALPETLTDARLQEIVHLEEVSHIAVLILLFFIGMELDLRTLRKVLRETRVASIFNILLPAVFVTGLARLAGWSLLEAVVLGIALSLSSTIFGERLSAGREFPAKARQRMFGVLLAEDVAAGALLALMALLAGGQGGGGWLEPLTAIGILLVALIVLAAIALLVVPRALDKVASLHSPELLLLSSGAFLLTFSAAGAWAGSGELGALKDTRLGPARPVSARQWLNRRLRGYVCSCSPDFRVAVCVVSPTFVQVTVSPALTVRLAGSKPQPSAFS